MSDTPETTTAPCSDILALTQRHLHLIATDGRLDQMVAKSVEEAVGKIVRDALSSYSPFAKALSDELKSALGVAPGSLGLQGYNQTVLNIVRAVIDARVEKDGRQAMQAALDDLLGETPPETIKLSKLAEQFGRWFKENQYGDERPWVQLETSDTTSHFRWLVFGARDTGSRTGFGGTRRREIGEETARMLVSMEEGKISCLRADGIDFSKTVFLGRGLRGFVRTLFQMQVAGTRIEIDTEAPADHLPDWHSDD